MPLKMIEAIAQFAPKAKKLADGLKLQQQKRQQKDLTKVSLQTILLTNLKLLKKEKN